MRITIQVTCDDAEDAQRVMRKLAAPDNTWVDQLGGQSTVFTPPINTKQLDVAREARIDKIMGSSATGAEQSLGNSGSEGAPRPNISPGEPSIGKIGSETKATLLSLIGNNQQPASKWHEHAKLLWKRGEIKFDGAEYYL